MTPHAYTRTDAIKTHARRAKSSRTESHRLTRVQNDASNLLNQWITASFRKFKVMWKFCSIGASRPSQYSDSISKPIW